MHDGVGVAGVHSNGESSALDRGQCGGLRSWQAITGALKGDLAMFGLDIALPMQLSWCAHSVHGL